MKSEIEKQRKKLLDTIFTVKLNGVEIAGKIMSIDAKGYTLNMIRPYSGLKTFVPILYNETDPLEIEKQIKAGLFLLYKKALMYSTHRKEIQGKFADYIKKLDKKNIDNSKEQYLDTFNEKKAKLRKMNEAKRISADEYYKQLRKERRKLLQRYRKLDKAQDAIEQKMFDGILKINDIQKLSKYFSNNFEKSETKRE